MLPSKDLLKSSDNDLGVAAKSRPPTSVPLVPSAMSTRDIYIYIYVYVCMYVYVHIYIYIHIHIVRTDLTGKLSKHSYAPDLGPKLPSQVISDLGPKHKYAPIAYRSNPFSRDHKGRQFKL